MSVPSVAADQVPSDAYLLDVREPDEWAAGHPPGAHHLPMHQVPARIGEVPIDRDVVVVCRSGQRSAGVVGYLNQQGRHNVRNLDGGLHAWRAAGLPLVDGAGGAGQVI